MLKVTVLIVVCFLAFASALPNPSRHQKGGTRKKSKQNEDDENQILQNNLPLVFAYDTYDYGEDYDYLYWYDCNGDICVYSDDYIYVERPIKLENSSLEITEDKWFDVNTTSLWTECAPSVPLEGRLAHFKSCYKWAKDNYNIFKWSYAYDVCNFRNRMWLDQNGEIDNAKIEEMYNQLDGFKEFMDSCMEWDGERPDYYDYYDDYDYRAEDVNKKNGKKVQSKKTTFKKKTKKLSGNKNGINNENRNKAKIGKKNEGMKRKKNKARKQNKNGAKKMKKGNKNGARKRSKNGDKTKNKKKRNKSANKNENNKHVNGMQFKQEAAKDKKKKSSKKKKKKKKEKKQIKALNLIDLVALPTELTVERLRCIDESLYQKLKQCGENILKNEKDIF